MLKRLIKSILGDYNEKELKKIEPLIPEINQKEEEYQKLSDDELKANTEKFKERLKNGEAVDDLLTEAFATVKNACRRLIGTKYKLGKEEGTWDMIPYDCQLVGGIALHKGKISEMKTGEGKTLVAALPVYLNALTGKGVHVVTVNDYLAKRDAEWMGTVYRYLGLTVGTIVHGLDHEERQEAYRADITYGTNNEFGFDYLRDNMVTSLERRVQRELNYAIVDEIDSILIDEARTPLIISSPAEESTKKYMQYAQLINRLQPETHYAIDEKARTATLTEEGIAELEKLLGVENIYTDAGFQEVHHIEQALKAKAIFKRDTDYLVKEGEIIIVDEFTGRLMPGRRYSDGLHQAIEAKEGVEVKQESKTLATVTFQNYFRLYNKLSGMTGTAKTEEEEFYKIYGLETLVIPTNKPVVRKDHSDLIYKSQKGKVMSVVKAIQEYYSKGQPVLVGTVSVEKSEMLSKLLKMNGVPHEVLNAKNHEREAEIVAQAGQKGAVTIATNMAGRGTDIKLGTGVKELGGLVIIGTERHDSRRIDNQLRGRAGRQGDPGETRFYVSMEDDLMRLFGADKIKNMMERLGLPDDMPIENRLINRSIESAQKRVEGHNFDIRKHLLEYDDVMNKHREIIYARRLKILENDDLKAEVLELMKKEAEDIVHSRTQSPNYTDWDLSGIAEAVNALLPHETKAVDVADFEKLDKPEDIADYLTNVLHTEHRLKEEALPDPGILRQVEKSILFRVVDTLWMEHIDAMTNLRESVALRGYGQRDPLIEYKQESFVMLKKLLASIQHNAINTLFKVQINLEQPVLAPKGQPDPGKLQTNEDKIEAGLTDPRRKMTAASPEARVAQRISAASSTPPPSAFPKVGRNDPCPCGSGKKYKKCHGVA
ncbi:preprotein translocase subunit SecA [Candidatus Peregrinibacteria bacterium]|nr:preprotein translocase subunit SecA [Candidatus Peregrinibacteria bacterium]